MNRRDFFKLGAAAGAGAVLSTRNAAGSPILEPGAGISQGAMILPADPGFKTKHLLTIILGNGARKIDVIDNEEHSPFQSKMIKEGTLFTEDYGETANLHGYMYTEVLTGRDAPSQRPLYPTWNEYVRKKTAGKASDFWMLQGSSYYRAWTW
ncbi:MAG: twin-arginine translocation signal domain-containing protein, partial [Vicinamibacteria bacterium]